jgi:LmbE family N-acetylglucosaminyl deacetylase
MYYREQLHDGITPHNARHIYLFPTDRANHWVDISNVVDQKVAALRCHASQTENRNMDEWVRRRGNIAGAEHKFPYAEPFHHFVM